MEQEYSYRWISPFPRKTSVHNILPMGLLLLLILTSVEFTRICQSMYIGKHMDWNAHIKSLSSKLNNARYMIKSLKDATSPLVRRSIYFAYFHTHLNYGLIFWGGDSKSKTIFKLQKRVTRLNSGVHILSSRRQLFKDYNLLPLP
jgi:hypothetical protein